MMRMDDWNRANQQDMGGDIHRQFVYRADLPPYDPATDDEPGRVIVAAGMHVTVLTIFHNWNFVDGLTLYFVRCHETGETTHVSPDELTPVREVAAA